jgi:ribosomal-protein-alanine N-acetyltransferase
MEPRASPLTKQNVQLRRFTLEDASVLAAVANDASIFAQVRDAFPHPYTLPVAEAYIAGLDAVYSAGTDLPMAITVEGQLAGGLGLHHKPAERRTSVGLGYWLGAAFRGRGVATAAVVQATALAWQRFPSALRLEAEVFSR